MPDPAGMRASDPGDPGSWNRYAYTHGDPVNRSDPSGLADEGGIQLPVFVICPDGTVRFFGGSGCSSNGSSSPGLVIIPFDGQKFLNSLSAMRTTFAARQLLADKLLDEEETNCGNTLQGFLSSEKGINDWNKIAGSITYYDMGLDKAALEMRDLPGYQENWADGGMLLWKYAETVIQEAGGGVGAMVVGNNVILPAGYQISILPGGMHMNTPAEKADILWHEFWHVATGLNDLDIVHQFINKNFSGSFDQASAQITNWLKRDCH